MTTGRPTRSACGFAACLGLAFMGCPAAPVLRPIQLEVAPGPTPEVTPVASGELPWWHALRPGVYRFRGRPAVLAVGRSSRHRHVAEGLSRARVSARLSVRKAAEHIEFSGPMPRSEMWDLFITRNGRFLALYEMPLERIPAAARPPTLDVPSSLRAKRRHRVGRHVFEGDRHLYLECEVEGPLANPNWGRDRASALLERP